MQEYVKIAFEGADVAVPYYRRTWDRFDLADAIRTYHDPEMILDSTDVRSGNYGSVFKLCTGSDGCTLVVKVTYFDPNDPQMYITNMLNEMFIHGYVTNVIDPEIAVAMPGAFIFEGECSCIVYERGTMTMTEFIKQNFFNATDEMHFDVLHKFYRAFQRGALHCDLSTNNVLMNKDMQPRLNDWGLAFLRVEPGRYMNIDTEQLTRAITTRLNETVHPRSPQAIFNARFLSIFTNEGLDTFMSKLCIYTFVTLYFMWLRVWFPGNKRRSFRFLDDLLMRIVPSDDETSFVEWFREMYTFINQLDRNGEVFNSQSLYGNLLLDIHDNAMANTRYEIVTIQA